jgi:hypothetical protein
MMLPSRRLAPVLLVSLLMGPAFACGPTDPVGGDGASDESTSSSGPGMTTLIADTTAATAADTDVVTTAVTSSTSGDPDTTDGTTQGVSATTTDGTTTDGTTTGGTTTDGTTDGSTSDASTGGSTDTGGSSDSGGMMMLPDISGDFLMALATPLDPSLPLQFIATFDFVAAGMGGTVDVELQPLALDQGSTTTPRTFFGPPLMFVGIPVAADGTFAINVGMMAIPAETNPIIFIDAQAQNVVMDVQILDADELCGTVSGDLVFPVMSPLAGTTLGAIRVADTMPASLPVVFPVACP